MQRHAVRKARLVGRPIWLQPHFRRLLWIVEQACPKPGCSQNWPPYKHDVVATRPQCCDRMIRWQFSPMRQLGVCTVNCNNPKLTHGAPRCLVVRMKTIHRVAALVMQQRVYFVPRQLIPPLQEIELDHKAQPHQIAAEFFDQLRDRLRRAARRQHVVDDQNFLSRLD